MPESPDSFAALSARNQKTLIEFLRVDLDLAFTFLHTAEIEADSDPAHCRAALQLVGVALASIRRFQGRIEDAGEWMKIHDRANELEAATPALS